MRTRSNSVGLPVGIRRRALRPSPVTRAARVVDRLVTRVQEWLEGPDRRIELVVAYGIIAVVLVVMAAAVMRRLVS